MSDPLNTSYQIPADRTPSEILKAARARIANKAHWTRKAYARDRWGHDLRGASDARAVRWCAAGAMQCEAADDHRLYSLAWDYLRDVAGDRGGVLNLNDKYGHSAVMALFDRAVEQAEADEVTR